MGYGDKHVEAAEVRKVRVALGDDQTEFGARFGKTRRTVIRWEQSGAVISTYARREFRKGLYVEVEKSPADKWDDLAELAKNPPATKAGRGSKSGSGKAANGPANTARAARSKARKKKSRKSDTRRRRRVSQRRGRK